MRSLGKLLVARILTSSLMLWAVVLSAVGLSAVGCKSITGDEAVTVQVVHTLRFPHAQHVSLSCTECHSDAAPGEPPPRPGENSHASCTTGACHASDFQGPPTAICGLCHESLQTEEGPRSSLVPYPPVAGPRSQAVRFSHVQHLEAERMETLLGFHISCIDCHTLSLPSEPASPKAALSELPRPTHESCARCHAPEAAPPGTPTMSGCDGCHEASSTTSRERSFIAGDLQFRHSSHRSDRRGRAIGCATCHESIAKRDTAGANTQSQFDMQVCVRCHNDDAQVAPAMRMSVCETCHATKSAGLSALAPRSHMPATERPANHTQAFRKDHRADANRPSAPCAKCHTMMSGNRRNTCDECHQVMEPRDHVVTWREYDHGPQAATLPDRCTTCHQVDFCVACHRSPPRSHFPSLDFRSGGHGTLAVLNMRACATCHQAANDCSGAGCHRGDGF